MKIICISNECNAWYFTIGKIYIYDNIASGGYYLLNDLGNYSFGPYRLFKTIKEHRSEIIKSLLK
jgi:hypothetical protein